MTAAVRRKARRLALLRHELIVAIRRAERDAERAAETRTAVLTEPAGNTQVA